MREEARRNGRKPLGRRRIIIFLILCFSLFNFMLQIPIVIINGAQGGEGERNGINYLLSIGMESNSVCLVRSAHVGSPAPLSIGGGVARRPAQGPLDVPSVSSLPSSPLLRLPSLSWPRDPASLSLSLAFPSWPGPAIRIGPGCSAWAHLFLFVWGASFPVLMKERWECV